MKEMISSYLPFPNISWWAYAAGHDAVCFEKEENFRKMSYRNRYYISGSNGMIVLSIPLEQGRNQRSLMKDVRISNSTRWQVQHWRTLVSVYARSPFFEHYEHSLKGLFEKRFEYLIDFNSASIEWVKSQSGFSFHEEVTSEYRTDYHEKLDLRQIKPGIEKRNEQAETGYYQVFADRIGFIPNLSILDLLFSEGRHTKNWIVANAAAITKWSK